MRSMSFNTNMYTHGDVRQQRLDKMKNNKSSSCILRHCTDKERARIKVLNFYHKRKQVLLQGSDFDECRRNEREPPTSFKLHQQYEPDVCLKTCSPTYKFSAELARSACIGSAFGGLSLSLTLSILQKATPLLPREAANGSVWAPPLSRSCQRWGRQGRENSRRFLRLTRPPCCYARGLFILPFPRCTYASTYMYCLVYTRGSTYMSPFLIINVN